MRPVITIERCEEKGHSVVSVRCKDRPKPMFDIVCILTDMHFVVFHAIISSDAPYASQMSGIDEAALGCISLVTQMTKDIRGRASGGKTSAPEIGQFSQIFVWLLWDFYMTQLKTKEK